MLAGWGFPVQAMYMEQQPGPVDESQVAASDFFERSVYVSHAT